MFPIFFLILFSVTHLQAMSPKSASAPDLTLTVDTSFLDTIEEDQQLNTPLRFRSSSAVSPLVEIQILSEVETPRGSSRTVTLFDIACHIHPETKKIIITPGNMETLIDGNFDALRTNSHELESKSLVLYYACVAKLIREEIESIKKDPLHQVRKQRFQNIIHYCQDHIPLQECCKDLARNPYNSDYYHEKLVRICKNYIDPAQDILRKAGLKLHGEK